MESFDRAVRTHGPTVLRVARAAVGADDADDVWSETFLAALRAWPLPDGTNIEAWLVRVAGRRAVDHHRARARRREAPDPAPDVATPQPDPATRLDVVAAVAALPDRQRLAVAHHHLGGLPWADVAVLLGCTPAAARRAGSDGIARMRSSGLLGDLGGDLA